MTLRLGLPKGRMEGGVLSLLGDAGIHVRPGARGYRPDVSLPETEAKLLKPQNVVERDQPGLLQPVRLDGLHDRCGGRAHGSAV